MTRKPLPRDLRKRTRKPHQVSVSNSTHKATLVEARRRGIGLSDLVEVACADVGEGVAVVPLVVTRSTFVLVQAHAEKQGYSLARVVELAVRRFVAGGECPDCVAEKAGV